MGSGSTYDPKFQPYFARLTAFNGADVTIVDIHPSAESDSRIHGVTADLILAVREKKLAELLGNKRFDLIHSSSFIGFNPPLEVVQRLDDLGLSITDFEKEFFTQAFEILEEGGVMSLGAKMEKDFDVYTKKDGMPVLL